MCCLMSVVIETFVPVIFVETTLLLEIREVENVSSLTEHAFNNMLNTDKKE